MREIVTDNGYVYCKKRKGMHGLPQVGLIAQELLEQPLSKVGYSQSKIIPGLWTHKTRKTCFTLVVNNFAIKFTKMEDAKHLIEALNKDYTITIDWGATKYIRLTIDWDYDNGQVHVYMPGYLGKAFLKFKHISPSKNKTHPIPMSFPNMEPRPNTPSPRVNPPSLIKRT